METMRGETPILKVNKYPNTRKAAKVVRTYKVPSSVDIQRETKAENTSKITEGKTI